MYSMCHCTSHVHSLIFTNLKRRADLLHFFCLWDRFSNLFIYFVVSANGFAVFIFQAEVQIVPGECCKCWALIVSCLCRTMDFVC